MRVVIVFDNFGPYHMARLAGAARQMDVLGVEVSATSAEYNWQAPDVPHGLTCTRLLDMGSARTDLPLLSSAYEKRVTPWRPDAIALPGWSSTAALAGIRWARANGVATVVMSETNKTDHTRRMATELVKRRIVSLFQAALCGGTLARSYLSDLGFSCDHIFLGYDVVDNDYFALGAQVARNPSEFPPLDSLQHGSYFLASARFVPKKNLSRLIEAFACYQQAAGTRAWPLVLLGDGPMRGELESQCATLGIESLVKMPGFTQYQELPRYYGNAGIFVHASTTEQWGLVVNEAMASGLPVLVSSNCGCAPDLVENGRNGYTFDPYDVGALATLMLRAASDACNRVAMGRVSREIIAKWSPRTFGDGLRQAVEAALRVPVLRSGWFEKTLMWALSHR